MDPITGAIAVGGSILGGVLGSNSAEDAAKEAAKASREAGEMQLTGMREALDAQMGMFDFSIGANAPQSEMGYGALGAMSQMLGLQAPTGDTRDYAAELNKAKRSRAHTQKELDKLQKLANDPKIRGDKATMLDLKAQGDALRQKRRNLDTDLEQLGRGQRQQQIQQTALSQFSGGEGGAGTAKIQAFDFDFDESQLGQTDAYKFRQEQSLEALDRRLASGGMRGSGNRYAGILDLAQGMASQEYEAEYGRQYGAARDKYSSQFDIYNMFAGMSGMAGVNAQQSVGVGGNMAGIIQQGYGGMAEGIMGAGQANAAGIMGKNTALQNTMSQLFQVGGDAGWFD